MADAQLRLGADASAERLAVVYAQAERDLRKIVKDASARGADGTAAYFDRQRRKVTRRLAELRAANELLVPPAVERAYMTSAEAAAAVLENAFEFAGPHERAIRALTDSMAGRLEEGLTTVGRSIDDVFRRVSLGEVAGGLARGDTRRAVGARIRNKLADEGVTMFRDRAGRAWKMDAYASMVARTTTREAATRGALDGIVDAGGDLTTVSFHSSSCDICRQFEGKTYSISGEDGRYPKLEHAAPFHPNCRHVMTPAAISLADLERELGLAEKAPPPEPVEPATPAEALQAAIKREQDRVWGDEPIAKTALAHGLDEPGVRSVGREVREHVEGRVNESVRAIEAQYGAAEARISEISKELLRGGDDLYAARPNAWRHLMRERGDKIVESTNLKAQLQVARSEAVRDAMQEVRPGFGEGKLKVFGDLGPDADIEDAARFLPKEWVERSNRARAKLQVWLRPAERAHYRGGLIQLSGPNNSTALHELGHRMEDVVKSIKSLEHDFYRRRTLKGNRPETRKRLRDLYPDRGYKDDEWARPDAFTNAYIGKDYSAKGRVGKNQFYEILTMGLEGVFYDRHAVALDKDMLDFVYGLLATG